MLEDFPFEQETVSLQPDDVVVICSDGITEAMNPNQEQFSAERLSDAIRKHRDRPAQELIAAIVEAVKLHASSAPQMDDITLVVIKRKGVSRAGTTGRVLSMNGFRVDKKTRSLRNISK